jgi:hypothetical protein
MFLLKRFHSILFILTILSAAGFAQDEIKAVKFELIPYESVRTYLNNQFKENIESFYEIKPSWHSDHSAKQYNIQKKSYLIKENLSHVWKHYRTTSPAESWNGKKVMFGFMFSKKQNQPLYPGDNFTAIDTGQVIFLNLKLLKFYDLAMAFEVISVDVENKIIEFSYIEGNTSQGKQTLQFIETRRGFTKIIHSSYFKSNSAIRDRYLYPFFHNRTTNEFHRIMRKMLRKES